MSGLITERSASFSRIHRGECFQNTKSSVRDTQLQMITSEKVGVTLGFQEA